MKKKIILLIFISLLIGLLITYVFYRDVIYVIAHISILLFVVLVLSLLLVITRILFLFFIKLFNKPRKKIQFRYLFLFIVVLSVIISSPILFLPACFFGITNAFPIDNIDETPVKYSIKTNEDIKDYLNIEKLGLKLALPNNYSIAVEEKLDYIIINLSNDNSILIRDDSDFSKKQMYIDIVNNLFGKANEDIDFIDRYIVNEYNMLFQQSEYKILKKIYTTVPSDFKIGSTIEEIGFTFLLLLNKYGESIGSAKPLYFIEEENKSGFYLENGFTTIYIEDKTIFMAFSNGIKIEDIMYTVGSIEIIE